LVSWADQRAARGNCGIDNKIKAEGAKAIAAALTPSTELPYNSSLTSLNLIGNTVGPEGAKALAEALKPNAAGAYCALHTLNLAVNNIQVRTLVARVRLRRSFSMTASPSSHEMGPRLLSVACSQDVSRKPP
jgi:hypothetical protein